MEECREYRLSRPQYLAGKLLPSEGSLVLDVGCGLGEFSDLLKERGFTAVDVDEDEEFIKRTRERGFESYCCDLEEDRLPFDDNTFDGVVCLEVIEHIWNRDNLLSEVERVLKPGAWLLLSTPNYNCAFYRITHLLGRFPLPLDTSHKRAYTTNTIVSVLRKYFEIENVVGISINPIVRKYFLTRLMPELLAMNAVVICRKKK